MTTAFPHIGRVQQFARGLTRFELPLLLLLLPFFVIVPRFVWVGVSGVGLLWLGRWLSTGRWLRPNPAAWPVFALLLLAPVSLWVTAFPQLTHAHVSHLLAGIALYFGIVHWASSEQRLLWLLALAMSLCALLAVAGLILLDPARAAATSVPPALWRLGQRFPETINPNVVSGALVIWLPAALAIAWRPPGSGRARQWLRLLATTAIAVSVVALALLNTRGAWLGLGLVAVLAVFRRWRLWGLLPLLVTALWLAASQGWLEIFSQALFSGDAIGGWDARVEIWRRAWLVLQGFPLTGSGMGTWEKLAPLLYPYLTIDSRTSVPHAHNLFLQVGIDLGVVGLGAYLALLGLSFRMAGQARRRFLAAGQPALATLSLAVWLGLAAMVIHGFVDAVTWGARPALMAWALMAQAAVLYLLPSEFAPPTPRLGMPFSAAKATLQAAFRDSQATIREAFPVAAVIALAIVLATAYGLVVLPWMQPDEPRHFEVVLHVARLGKPILTGADRSLAWEQEIIAAMEEESFWWYGFSLVGWDPYNLPGSFAEIWGQTFSTAFFQPPLYYALSGSLLAIWGQHLSLADAVLWLRMLNLLFLAPALAGVYMTVRELFPQRQNLALAGLALAALWPSHLAATMAVNNDALAALFTIWALYCAVRLLRRGPDVATLSWLLALSVLAFSAKRTGLSAPLAAVLALALWAGADLMRRQNPRARMLNVALLGLAALAGGLLLTFAVRTGRLGLPSTVIEALMAGTYWSELASAPWAEFTRALLRTFVGWFGWMRAPLPEPFYWLGTALLAAAGLGLLRLLAMGRLRTLAGWQKQGLLLLLIVLLAQFFLVAGKELIYGTWRDGSLPQARYLYPVLPALWVSLLLGWRAWLPQRWNAAALPVGFAALLLFNFYVLAYVLYPFFWHG